MKKHAEAVTEFCNVALVFSVASDNTKGKLIVQEKNENANFTTYLFYYKKHITHIGFLDKIIKFFLFHYTLFKGYKLVRKTIFNPDMLHVNVAKRVGFMALFLKLFYTEKYMVTEHATLFLSHLNFWQKIYYNKVFKTAKSVNSVSEKLKNILEQKFDLKNVQLVPNVISDIYLKQSRKRQSESYFLHVSDLLDKTKNVSGVLKAVKKLSILKSDFKVIFVGEGVDEQKFLEMVKSLRIETFVQFVGTKNEKELAEYYSKSLAYISFSRKETFGITCYEALACGTPIIVSDIDVFKNALPVNFSLFVRNENEDDLASKMAFILNNKTHFDDKIDAMKNFISEKYTSQKIAQQFLEIYKLADV